jgi:hypothetical protein
MELVQCKIEKCGSLVEIHKPLVFCNEPYAQEIAGTKNKYVIVCVDHATIRKTPTKADATALACSSPAWCPGCEPTPPKPRKPRRVGRKRTKARYHA